MSLLLTAAPVAAIVIIVLLKHLLSPLRSVPGPFAAKWTDLWYLIRVSHGNYEQDGLQLHEKYGPIVRYGPNRVSFSSPEATKTVYGHGTRFAKSSWYSTWTVPAPAHSTGMESWSIFADQSIPRHAHNRRLFQSTYSLTTLLSYEPYVDDCADLFYQRLAELSQSGLSIDMRHWFQCYAFDVIGMITYGKRFGFLDRGEDVGGIIEALETHLYYATAVGIYPSLHPILFKLRNYFAGKKGSGRAYIVSFTLERIAEEIASGKAVPIHDGEIEEGKAESFVSKFLAKNAEDPDRFTRQHIIDGCTSNMVAGSDTTAISLSATLFYLLKHRECYAKLLDEIKSFTEQGLLSERPTFQETQKMPYLQAAIKEALRVHAIAALPIERVVPEGGTVINGYHLPSGTIVGVHTWAEHRDRGVFGEDADTFNPDRWLTSDTERLNRMNRQWIPFGMGSRTCIGRHISMLEMTKLIPRIIRDFNFQLDGAGAVGDQVWPTQSYWFVKPTDFRVKIVSERKS